MRSIAKALGIARTTVRRALAKYDHSRAEGARHPGLPAPPGTRNSLLDPYEETIKELLGRYPNMTVVRILEELGDRGFTGSFPKRRRASGVNRKLIARETTCVRDMLS